MKRPYLAASLLAASVLLFANAAEAMSDCILPSFGYEHYDCNKTSAPIPEVKIDAKPDAAHCVTVYHSGTPDRVCSTHKRVP